MEIVSGKTGSPHVTSQQFRQILEGTAGQGSCILTSGENLEPELTSNNLLKIRSGIMAHHGNVSAVKIGTYDEVTITNGTQGMKRKDLVVNRYTRNKETGIETNEWLYIMGTPTSGTPTVPAYTKGNQCDGSEKVVGCVAVNGYNSARYDPVHRNAEIRSTITADGKVKNPESCGHQFRSRRNNR